MARFPHVLLVTLAVASLTLEVALFEGMGQRWPALGPGPLPAWLAVGITAGSNLAWSYVYWRGLEWRGPRPLLRAMVYVGAITVVAFPFAGLLLLARWDEVLPQFVKVMPTD